MKKILAIFLIAIVIFGACRKADKNPAIIGQSEIKTPKSGIIDQKPVISNAEVSNWFAKNPFGAHLKVDWTKARQKQLRGIGIVTVPVTSVVGAENNRRIQGLKSNSTGPIPGFDPNHPPALYFFKVLNSPDSVRAILMNFLPDDPSHENSDTIWTGKLIDWTMQTDTANTQFLTKSYVKKVGKFVIGQHTSSGNSIKLGTNNFWDWLGGVVTTVANAIIDVINYVGHFLGIAGDYSDTIDENPVIKNWCHFLGIDWCSAGGGGSSSGSGVGSTVSNLNFVASLYASYVPGYNGYDGGNWDPYQTGNPCGGSQNVASSKLTTQQVPGGNGPCDPTIQTQPQTTVYDSEIYGPSLLDIYVDPNTGESIRFSDVLSTFQNNPNLIYNLEEENLDQINYPGPGNPIMASVLLTRAISIEAATLRALHPSWSSSYVWATASWNILNGGIHVTLDLVGLIPALGAIPDLVNGGIYYIEGDYINCAFSAAAAVPFEGWVAISGKWVRAGTKWTVPLTEKALKTGVKVIKNGKDVRFVKVAVDVFDYTALKLASFIKPANATLTNLSRGLIDKYGIRILPTETTLKNLVEDIKLGDQYGFKTEQLADKVLEKEGFLKYDAKIGSNNGLDGVYIKGGLDNPTEIIINESKQMNLAGNIKLNPGNVNTGLESQMSDAWIQQKINTMINSNDVAKRTLGMALYNNKNLITKTITAVDKGSSEIVILKLESY